jgi:mono/diheme cytochrome c family protein
MSMKTSIFYFFFAIFCLINSVKAQSFDLKASMERGKSVYAAQCMSCHMQEGEGLEGVFPPLAKSSHLASKEKLVKIILKGMRGTINVAGKEYNGEMAGIMLSDEETADVINFIRNSFGNKAPAVKPNEIQSALKAVVKDYQPY